MNATVTMDNQSYKSGSIEQRDLLECLDRIEKGLNSYVVRPTVYSREFLIADVVREYIAIKPSANILILHANSEDRKNIEDFLKNDKNDVIPSNINIISYRKLSFERSPINHIDKYNIIIFNECHKIGGAGINKVVDDVLSVNLSAIRVGLTSTPIRGDGKDIENEYFTDSRISEYGIRDAIDDGEMTPIRYIVGVSEDCIKTKVREMYRTNSGEKIQLLTDNLYINFGAPQRILNTLSEIYGDNIPKTLNIVGFLPSKKEDTVKELLKLLEDTFTRYRIVKFSRRSKQPTDEYLINLAVNPNLEMSVGFQTDILIMLHKTHSDRVYLKQLGKAFSDSKDRIPVIFDFIDNAHTDFQSYSPSDSPESEDKPTNIDKTQTFRYEIQGFVDEDISRIERVIAGANKELEDARRNAEIESQRKLSTATNKPNTDIDTGETSLIGDIPNREAKHTDNRLAIGEIEISGLISKLYHRSNRLGAKILDKIQFSSADVQEFQDIYKKVLDLIKESETDGRFTASNKNTLSTLKSKLRNMMDYDKRLASESVTSIIREKFGNYGAMRQKILDNPKVKPLISSSGEIDIIDSEQTVGVKGDSLRIPEIKVAISGPIILDGDTDAKLKLLGYKDLGSEIDSEIDKYSYNIHHWREAHPSIKKLMPAGLKPFGFGTYDRSTYIDKYVRYNVGYNLNDGYRVKLLSLENKCIKETVFGSLGSFILHDLYYNKNLILTANTVLNYLLYHGLGDSDIDWSLYRILCDIVDICHFNRENLKDISLTECNQAVKINDVYVNEFSQTFIKHLITVYKLRSSRWNSGVRSARIIGLYAADIISEDIRENFDDDILDDLIL